MEAEERLGSDIVCLRYDTILIYECYCSNYEVYQVK